jgi:hypothetical protein
MLNFAKTEFSEVHTGDDVEQYRAYVNQAGVPELSPGAPAPPASTSCPVAVAVSTYPEQSWRETQSRWRLLRMTDGPSRPTLEPRSNESREEMTVGYATTNPYTNEVVETFPDATDVELAA